MMLLQVDGLAVMYTLNFHSVSLHFVNKFRNFKICVTKMSKTSELNATDIKRLKVNPFFNTS